MLFVDADPGKVYVEDIIVTPSPGEFKKQQENIITK